MTRFLYILLGIVIVGGIAFGAWWYLFTPTPPAQTTGTGFGSGAPVVQVTPTGQSTSGTQAPNSTASVQQKVFRVGNGPIVGATVVQYTRPTTTVARYVQQNNGHVFDLVLDSSGALPKAISNTTIPGVARALWTKKGEGVILQYLDGNTVKTVSLSFPPQQSTSTAAVGIKFLPDGIADIVVSPSGGSVAYLLRTQTGMRGYIAGADGSASRELFTLPLKEVSITWPAESRILAYSKPMVGVPGVAFSITTSAGAVVPLLHASGLSVAADPAYTYLLYQTSAGTSPSTYVRTLSTGGNTGLSFDPAPERCVWGSMATTTLYCATSLQYVPPNYQTAWHLGTADAPEAIIAYTFPGGRSTIVTSPGSDEGGVASTIDTLSVDASGKYILFVRRGDRSLWGVRL